MSQHQTFWTKLRSAYNHSSSGELRSQILRGALIGLLLLPIIFTCFAGSAMLFGYRFTGTHGTSMEPALHDGDVIWLKRVDAVDTGVKIGDIVVLTSSETESISHRVIGIEPIFEGRYLIETKGDANSLSEHWLVSDEDTVYIIVAHIPLGGYVLDFIGNIYGRAAIIGLGIIALIAIRARRSRVKQT